MPATSDARMQTRAYARVIGPWLAIVPGVIALRVPDIGSFLSGFFDDPVLVWFVGALLLFGGLLIIAFHQYWSGAAAIMISLFGWFLALRGLALLAAPRLIERGAAASLDALPLVRLGFGVFVAIGLYLTYVGWLAQPAPGPARPAP